MTSHNYKQHGVSLAPNGRGAHSYLSRDLLDDSRCPLNQGDRATARLIPGVGILIVPDPELDVEVYRERE